MKTKIILLMLVCTGVQAKLFAQQSIFYLPYSQQSRADQLFANTLKGNIRFDFQMPAGNKMILELTSLNQLDSMPGIGQLLSEVWSDLENFKDSLQKPLVNRKIDYLVNPQSRTIRIQEFPQKGDIYNIRKGDITQLKIEQDTIRIKIFTKGRPMTFFKGERIVEPYIITLLLNNVAELSSIAADGRLQSAIDLLKKDVAVKSNEKSRRQYSRYYALYDISLQKRINPRSASRLGSHKAIILPPYVQTGIQYMRGNWMASIGVGLELTWREEMNFERHYRLMWEPYFSFDRNSLNKLTVGRNEFLTFTYSEKSKFSDGHREIEFKQNFSFGYLINKRGDWFESNTFKFALPGLQTKNILIEPEFIFNDFFRHFSPSMKFTLFFE